MRTEKPFFSRLFAWVLIGAGTLFRVRHLFRIPLDEPCCLGGLFYEFSRQIQLHHFALPRVIPWYSEGGIPFAYPPLGFYLHAALSALLSPPKFLLINILPPLLAVLSLPLFYALAKEWYEKDAPALAALFAYAFMPAAFTNQIEAAGLAEATGSLALLAYAYALLRFERESRLRSVMASGVFLAASIAASPGSAIGATTLSLLYAATLLPRARRAALPKLLLVGVLGALLSAPYVGLVLRNHGAEVFLRPIAGQYAGAQTGFFLLRFLKYILKFNIADGSIVLVWNALIFLGFSWMLLENQVFLPLLFLAFALIPRENVWLVAFPAAFLAASALVEWLLPGLSTRAALQNQRGKRRALLLVTILLLVLSAGAILPSEQKLSDENMRLPSREIASMESIREELPENAKLIVLGSETFKEWAPQILRREVINEIYGLEWKPQTLARVLSLNEMLDRACSWEEIESALIQYGNLKTVYLLSEPRTFCGETPPALWADESLTLYLISLEGTP